MARASDEQIARQLTERLVAAFRPRRVVWFGSRVRGTGGDDSDWDMMVVADSDESQARRMYAAHRATADIEVPKDIIVVTPEEHARLLAWTSSVVRRAEAEGLVLHEAA